MLGFLNCDDTCMCVVKKQFEFLMLAFYFVYVDLQYDIIYLILPLSHCVCVVSVVVLGLYVRLSSYPMMMCWLR